MEIDQLEEAVESLETTISEFPIGAQTVNDLLPTEEKIANVRQTLKQINARYITLKAIIDGISMDSPQHSTNKSYERLNHDTTNYLINYKTVKMCYQSKAIQEIISNDTAPLELKEKVKNCLEQLFVIDQRLSGKYKQKAKLTVQLNKLKLENHHAIYEYQDYLKALEAKKQQFILENDPNLLHQKEKIDQVLGKINTMKKLMTNMIAAISKDLYKNRGFIDILVKHKDLINFDDIRQEINEESS